MPHLWESDPAVLDRLWQSNVCTVWSTATATVPQLLRTAHAGIPASFVAVASLAGHTGLYHLSAYCAVKHAVVGLIRGWAADLVNQGVYVSAVSPDAMATAMLDATASLYGLDSVDALVAGHGVPRTAQPRRRRCHGGVRLRERPDRARHGDPGHWRVGDVAAMHHKKSMPPDPPSMPIPVAGMSVRLAPAVRVCDDGRLLVSTRSGTAVRLRPAVDRVLGGEHGRPSARSFEVTDPTRWVLATALLRRDLAEPLW